MKVKLFLLSTLILLSFACSKLTEENYNKLKVGMPYDEVKSILGNPDRCSDVLGAKSCIWGDENRHITVNFIGDKVAIFTAKNIR